MDLWAPSVPTQAYAADNFDCAAGTPVPSPKTVRPDQGIRGLSVQLTISGANLKSGSQVSLGPGITINGTSLFAEGVLSVSASILPDAVPGLRELTVTNPGAPPVTLPGAFEVKAASTPVVAIAYPAANQLVKGSVTVTASASGDLPITHVDFSLDGAPLGSASHFPFQFPWNASASGNGPHTLLATAFDTASQSAASAPVSVIVCNNPIPGDCDCSGQVSIGEVQKAVNMFLGIVPPGCGGDCNGDGTVSIGEVQKVINAFLGLTSSC